MKEIPLTQNKVAIVDDGDFHFLSSMKWHLAKRGDHNYAATKTTLPGGKQVNQYMHRILLDVVEQSGTEQRIEFLNENGLDNRRSNLRVLTFTNSMRRRKRGTNNKSGYRGVFWEKRHQRWCAIIQVDGKQLYLGEYQTVLNAALAYDAAASKYFGEFARLNFPNEKKEIIECENSSSPSSSVASSVRVFFSRCSHFLRSVMSKLTPWRP